MNESMDFDANAAASVIAPSHSSPGSLKQDPTLPPDNSRSSEEAGTARTSPSLLQQISRLRRELNCLCSTPYLSLVPNETAHSLDHFLCRARCPMGGVHGIVTDLQTLSAQSWQTVEGVRSALKDRSLAQRKEYSKDAEALLAKLHAIQSSRLSTILQRRVLRRAAARIDRAGVSVVADTCCSLVEHAAVKQLGADAVSVKMGGQSVNEASVAMEGDEQTDGGTSADSKQLILVHSKSQSTGNEVTISIANDGMAASVCNNGSQPSPFTNCKDALASAFAAQLCVLRLVHHAFNCADVPPVVENLPNVHHDEGTRIAVLDQTHMVWYLGSSPAAVSAMMQAQQPEQSQDSGNRHTSSTFNALLLRLHGLLPDSKSNETLHYHAATVCSNGNPGIIVHPPVAVSWGFCGKLASIVQVDSRNWFRGTSNSQDNIQLSGPSTAVPNPNDSPSMRFSRQDGMLHAGHRQWGHTGGVIAVQGQQASNPVLISYIPLQRESTADDVSEILKLLRKAVAARSLWMQLFNSRNLPSDFHGDDKWSIFAAQDDQFSLQLTIPLPAYSMHARDALNVSVTTGSRIDGADCVVNIDSLADSQVPTQVVKACQDSVAKLDVMLLLQVLRDYGNNASTKQPTT